MSLIESIHSWFKSLFEKREDKRLQRNLEAEKLRRIREREQEEEYFLYRLGNDFEDHVINMFDPDRFELIHRSPTNDDTGGRFVKSMILPDLNSEKNPQEEVFGSNVNSEQILKILEISSGVPKIS